MSIFSFLKERFYNKDYINKFNFNIWSNLSLKQKKKLIQQFENDEAQIQNRKPIDIKYKDLDKFKCGEYNFLSKEIILNADLLKDDPYKLLYTIAHEGRHAFQDFDLQNSKLESGKQYLWQLNVLIKNNQFINYQLPQNHYEWYYSQPVEYDANSYALARCKEICNKTKDNNFKKWLDGKEIEMKSILKQAYDFNPNFEKCMIKCFESTATAHGFQLDKKDKFNDVLWVNEVKEFREKELQEKILSIQDTAPIDVKEINDRLSEHKLKSNDDEFMKEYLEKQRRKARAKERQKDLSVER